MCKILRINQKKKKINNEAELYMKLFGFRLRSIFRIGFHPEFFAEN